MRVMRVADRSAVEPPIWGAVAFHTPIRGYAFAAVPPPTDAAIVEGAPVLLLREPDNPADPLAVGVWLVHADRPRWRLGYLDRTVAARVSPRMDAGARIAGTIDGWVEEPQGRWRRPLLHLRLEAVERTRTDDAVVASEERGSRRSLGRMPPGVTRRRVLRRRR
jgi:hypothetical protein